MADLINRQKAIDAINAQCDEWENARGGLVYAQGLRSAIPILDTIPTAELEKIRCKDCKYKYVDSDNVKFNLCALNHNRAQSDDWYCADAEREENDG